MTIINKMRAKSIYFLFTITILSLTVLPLVRSSFSDLYSLKSTSSSSSVPDKVYITSFYNILWNCLDSDKDMSSCLKSQILFLLDNSLKNDVAPILKEPTLKNVIDQEFKDAGVSDDDDDDDDDDNDDDGKGDNDNNDNDNDERGIGVNYEGTGIVETIRSIAKRYFDDKFEGRKKYKRLGQSMTIALVTGAFMLGSLSYKFISLLAGKALLIAKIALILAVIANLRKSYSHSHALDYEKRARNLLPIAIDRRTVEVKLRSSTELNEPYRYYNREKSY